MQPTAANWTPKPSEHPPLPAEASCECCQPCEESYDLDMETLRSELDRVHAEAAHQRRRLADVERQFTDAAAERDRAMLALETLAKHLDRMLSASPHQAEEDAAAAEVAAGPCGTAAREVA